MTLAPAAAAKNSRSAMTPRVAEARNPRLDAIGEEQ
jgi:hypothetical protein